MSRTDVANDELGGSVSVNRGVATAFCRSDWIDSVGRLRSRTEAHLKAAHQRQAGGEAAGFDGVQHTARQMKILQKREPLPWKTWHAKRKGSKRIRISIRPFICLSVRPACLPAFCLFGSCCVSLLLRNEEDLSPASLTGFQEPCSRGSRAAHETFTPVCFRAPTFAASVPRLLVGAPALDAAPLVLPCLCLHIPHISASCRTGFYVCVMSHPSPRPAEAQPQQRACYVGSTLGPPCGRLLCMPAVGFGQCSLHRWTSQTPVLSRLLHALADRLPASLTFHCRCRFCSRPGWYYREKKTVNKVTLTSSM